MMRVILTAGLFVALLGAAITKWRFTQVNGATLVDGVVIGLELLLCAGLMISRIRRVALLGCIGGYGGAALGGLWKLSQGLGASPCGCVGGVDLSVAHSLVLQSAVICAALLASASPSGRSVIDTGSGLEDG